MINWQLFTVRNFVVIGAFAIIAHILAKPLYSAIDGDPDNK